MTPTAAPVIYPELPNPLTPGDLQQLFSPSFDERKWAPTVTRTPEAQVALLVQLKIFQTNGRFLPVVDVPLVTIESARFRSLRATEWSDSHGHLEWPLLRNGQGSVNDGFLRSELRTMDFWRGGRMAANSPDPSHR